MAIVLNILLLLLEIRGLMLCPRGEKWRLLTFYTLLSNLVAVISSLLLLAAGQTGFAAALRYLSACMLLMTSTVTICILVPMGKDARMLLASGNGLYHHTLCPAVCLVSYLFFERHAGFSALWLPVSVTLLYGAVMLCLNAGGIVDGPYPFFRVRQQSGRATVLWTAALLGAITGLSAFVAWIAG